MRLWCIMAIFGAGLAAATPATPVQSQPAQTNTCDADAKPANLDFVLKDMNGKDVALSAYKGKVILLDFWATWCAPCKIEIPNFVELYTKYQSRGFVVLGISVDDPVSALKSFAEQFKMNYPVLVGADRDDVKNAFGPPVGFPTAFIIGRDGKICTSHTGFATKEQFEQEILPLL
jgi:cytochrome c biogenesis protein CcmG/thiol:disulfide interchange protein DsbE